MNCGDTKTTLNVDHQFYERGRDPWDYPDDSLWSLCETCHARITGTRSLLARLVGGVTEHQLEILLAHAQVMRDTERIEIRSVSHAAGVAMAFDSMELWDRLRVGSTVAFAVFIEHRDAKQSGVACRCSFCLVGEGGDC